MAPADVEAAMERLCAPDPSSRSPECEGRRLVPCAFEGQRDGWLVVNAVKYRETQTVAQARAAARQAKTRAKAKRGKSKKQREVEAFDNAAGNVAPSFVYDQDEEEREAGGVE